MYRKDEEMLEENSNGVPKRTEKLLEELEKFLEIPGRIFFFLA